MPQQRLIQKGAMRPGANSARRLGLIFTGAIVVIGLLAPDELVLKNHFAPQVGAIICWTDGGYGL